MPVAPGCPGSDRRAAAQEATRHSRAREDAPSASFLCPQIPRVAGSCYGEGQGGDAGLKNSLHSSLTKSSRWAVSFPQASMDRDCKGPQRPCPCLSRLALCGPVRAGLISLIVNHRPATSAPAKEVEGSSAFPLIKCLRPRMLTSC